MSRAVDRYCAGCIEELPGAADCTRCFWDDQSEPETQSHLPRHSLLLDRYYIGRVLGQGGFGITYLARDLERGQRLAIKEYFPTGQCSRLNNRRTIRSHEGEGAQHYGFGLERFLEEGRNLQRFRGNPYIVQVRNVFKGNGTAYLAMDYLDGFTLRTHLKNRGGTTPYRDAVALLSPVLSGLRDIHANGMIHRDVSPDNIIISRNAPATLIDFGAARYAIGEQSQNLTMVLKPGYAPWEQYQSRARQGPFTDVYAMAATLYRCVTGSTPQAAPDRLSADELVAPSRLAPNLPRDFEHVLLKGLAVKAENRYRTMDEFATALNAAIVEKTTAVAVLKPKPVKAAAVSKLLVAEKGPEPDAVPVPEYRIFSVRSITWATVLGGPLAGCILIAANYHKLGSRKGMWGALALALACLVCSGVIAHFASGATLGVGIAMIFVMRQTAQIGQGAAIESHRSRGGQLMSGWAALGVAVLCLTGLLLIVTIYAATASSF